MRGTRGHVAIIKRRPARRVACAVTLLVCVLAAAHTSSAQTKADQRSQERLEMRRGEGEALLSLADAAMGGRASSDFSIGWTNDFFKAQSGTFVPFTVTIDRSALTAADALMYVRATRRDAVAAPVPIRYPFDIIFPVPLSAPPGQPLRITRGFAVAPGDYDVYVALRERAADPRGSDRRLKGAVLKQPLTVPDFWTGELATSTVMLADRIEPVTAVVVGDEVLERPYVIGSNEVHRAAGTAFKKRPRVDRGLPDLQPGGFVGQELRHRSGLSPVQEGRRRAAEAADEADHPPARPGEAYVTRTTPQRFKPAAMGANFDPASGPDPRRPGDSALVVSGGRVSTWALR